MVFKGSHDDVNFDELHYSTTHLCEGNSYHVDLDDKMYCKPYTTKSFDISYNSIAYKYYRIKMPTNSGSIPEHVNRLIFSQIEIYGIFDDTFKVYYSCKLDFFNSFFALSSLIILSR